MGAWLTEGKFKQQEERLDGIERLPESMLLLYTGQAGKLLAAP